MAETFPKWEDTSPVTEAPRFEDTQPIEEVPTFEQTTKPTVKDEIRAAIPEIVSQIRQAVIQPPQMAEFTPQQIQQTNPEATVDVRAMEPPPTNVEGVQLAGNLQPGSVETMPKLEAPEAAAQLQAAQRFIYNPEDPLGLKGMQELGSAAYSKGMGEQVAQEQEKALQDFTVENFKGIVLYPAAIASVANAVGWYVANRTLPGSVAAAREAVTKGLVRNGVPAEQASRMADEGMTQAVAKAQAAGSEVGIPEFVKIRKAAERGFGPKEGTPNVPAVALEPAPRPAPEAPVAPVKAPAPVQAPKFEETVPLREGPLPEAPDWTNVDAVSDPFRKYSWLEKIANSTKGEVNESALIGVLDRLEQIEPQVGSNAWNVAWAVSQNPKATPDIKDRALALREQWMKPGREFMTQEEPLAEAPAAEVKAGEGEVVKKQIENIESAYRQDIGKARRGEASVFDDTSFQTALKASTVVKNIESDPINTFKYISSNTGESVESLSNKFMSSTPDKMAVGGFENRIKNVAELRKLVYKYASKDMSGWEKSSPYPPSGEPAKTMPQKVMPSKIDKLRQTKITDESGIPLRVYHGTTAPENFTEFSVGGFVEGGEEVVRTGSGGDPRTFLGSHFAKEPEVANKFAKGLYGEREFTKGAGGRIIPAFLNIKNPFKTSDSEMMDKMLEGDYSSSSVEDQINREADNLGIDIDEANDKYVKDIEFRKEINKSALEEEERYDEPTFELAREMSDDFKSNLISKGYDGIVYKNEIEGGTSYIVFSPEQVINGVGGLGKKIQSVGPSSPAKTMPKAPADAVSEAKPSLESVTQELSKDVTKAVGDTTPPIGLSIRKVGESPVEGEAFKFSDPKIEKRWEAAHGVEQKSVGQKLREKLQVLKNQATREFEHLPRGPEHVELRKNLLELQKEKSIAADKALRLEQGVTIGLGKSDYELFEKAILVNDLKQEAKIGNTLPFDFTPESLAKEAQGVDNAVANNPKVQQAIAKRKQMYEGLKATYSEAMDSIGVDVSERLGKEDYYHHQVLEYANKKTGDAVQGGGVKSPAGRGFLKKRKGSALDINTDYFQAETEVVAQMIHDIKVAKTIKFVEEKYDISSKVKELGGIPAGYVEWQPRKGNTFYMAASIPEKLAAQITDGLVTSISPEDIKRVMALGGRRKALVIPEEVANTLDEMGTPRPPAGISEKLLQAWKVYQLISPTRFLKYNIRNVTGDADAVIAFAPKAFSKAIEASNELIATLYKNAPMSEDLTSFFERGGLQSNLQFGELGDIKDLEIVERFSKDKTLAEKLKSSPATAWNAWWGGSRKFTDYREAILRLAVYKHYLRAMEKSGGKPPDFGASDPEEIMALSDIKDRAYWISNDIMGAYDKVSVLGQKVRERYFPFWSFKEANFKRYFQGAKNAAYDGNAIRFAGRAFGAKTPYMAYKVGKFVIAATAMWATFEAWNNTFYPEEEKAIPEDIRRRPHLVFGTDDNGDVRYFSKMGALGDVLAWFGMDTPVSTVRDYVNGRLTIKEIAEDMVKSPANVIASGAAPFQKTIFEVAFGRSSFPDIFKPRTIRDRGLYLAQQFGLGEEYKNIMGLPSKPYGRRAENLLYYEINPLESAYFKIQDEKRRWAKKNGTAYDGFIITAKASALYNLKMAIRFKDKIAFDKYNAEYKRHGGSPKDMSVAIKKMRPLSGVKDKAGFVDSLSAEDKENLEKADKFYDEVILSGKEELSQNGESIGLGEVLTSGEPVTFNRE